MIEPLRGFVMVYLSTPVEICERRDGKGLYAKARAGILKDFTGISDFYEEPKDADIVINTAEVTPEEAAQPIMLHMKREGLSGLTTICNPLNISRTHLAKKTAILTSDSGSERLDPLGRWPTLRRCDRAIDRPHRSQTVADEVKKSHNSGDR